MAEFYQFVTFFIIEEMYGIDIRLIKEVNPNIDICPVPRSAENIRGIINIRGQVVLVLDTGTLLGKQKQNISVNTHIIILKTKTDIYHSKDIDENWQINKYGDKPIGLIIDKIGDVIKIGRDRIEKAPRHIDKSRINFYNGVIKIEEKPLLILNVEEMI